MLIGNRFGLSAAGHVSLPGHPYRPRRIKQFRARSEGKNVQEVPPSMKKRKEVEETLKSAGITKQTAKKVLDVWRKNGANNPAALRKLFVQKGLRKSGLLAAGLGLDGGAALLAFYTAGQLRVGQPFGGATIAVEYLCFAFGIYVGISAVLDLFSLLTVAAATARYSTSADAFLVAVEEMAGADASAFGVVDKARQAVNMVKVIQALDAILFLLKSTSDKEDFLNDLGGYLSLERAERLFQFKPQEYGLTDAEAADIASVFSKYDLNDDGTIDLGEFKLLCSTEKTAAALTNEEVDAAFKLLDKGDTGAITFNEWVAWWVEKKSP